MATKTTPSVREAVDTYLAEYELEWSKQTMKSYSSLLNRFVNFTPPIQVGRLTTDHYTKFLRQLRSSNAWGRPSSARTVNIARDRLRGFITYCGRKGWGRGDLLDHAGRMKMEVAHDFLRLSADELLQMLNDAEHPRDRALLAAGMNTALRASELITVRIQDVDLEQGEFQATIYKTTDRDLFPISADLDTEWRSWLDWYKNNVPDGLRDHYFMFPAKKGRRWTGKDTFVQGEINPVAQMNHAGKVVKRGLLKLGFSEERIRKEGMHTLRRSVGRLYFEAIRDEGYDYALRETMAFLHHANTKTTELYLGLSIEKSKRDARLRGKPFLSALGTQNNILAIAK